MNFGSSVLSSTWKIQEWFDTWVGSGKVHTRLLRGACNMRQGSRFNLEDVVRHLFGRDASLRWMYTSLGVPLKASANRRGESCNANYIVSTDAVRPAISR